MKQCPDEATLSLMLSDRLSAADAGAVEAHVESCNPCRNRLEMLYRASDISLLRQGAPDPPGGEAIRLPAPAAPQFIGRLAGFDIESVLGEGGMGVVYRARDSHLGRLVAIKVFFDFPGFRQIFDREARAAAAVKDDHVVTILHVVTQTPEFRQPFIVMELIQGGSLEDRLKARSPLPVRQAATIAHGVAHGLAATHAQGLVHRDIKPSNIMLDEQSGRARITDFGLARAAEQLEGSLTRKGGTPGTPAYMSPEQFSAPDKVDGRSDIFSLGVVLYEMLTGQLPFSGNTPEEIALQLRTANPPAPRSVDPKIPRDLETICLVCLDSDPGHRFADAAALAEDLRRFLNHEPIHSKRPGLRRRLMLFALRNRSLVRLTAVFLALVVLGAAGAFIALSLEQDRTESASVLAATESKLAKAMAVEAALRKARELRTRYLLEVKDAYRAWQANNFDEARVLLDLQVPAQPGDQDLREVEWYYLDHVLGATRRVLDFGGPAYAARFSPDGKRLGAAGITETDGYCIKLWEFPRLRHERTLVLAPAGSSSTTSPPAGLENMVFSPDGSLLAATYAFHKENRIDGLAKVWESDTGRLVFSASDAGIGGLAVLFSPDGRFLIVGCYENAALVWEIPGGKLRWTLPGYDPSGVAGSPSGVAPRIARPLWNSDVGLEGDVLLMPSVHDVGKIPVSGTNLVVLADVDNVLHLRTFHRSSGKAWDGDEIRGDGSDAHTAQQIRDLRRRLVGLWPPHRLTDIEKERIIAAVASIYHGQHSLDTPPVAHLLFSPGNEYLDRSSLSSDHASARTAWPPADPPAYDDSGRPSGDIEQDRILTYSPPDGAWGLSSHAQQGGLRLFHTAAWNGGRPEGDTGTASPVLDLRTVFPVIIDQGIEAVALATDQLAIAGGAGRVAAIRFDVNTGSVLARSVPKPDKGGHVLCLAFSPAAGEHLAACSGRSVTIWSNIFAPPGKRLFESALRPHDAVVADNRRWRLDLVRSDPQKGQFQLVVEITDRVSGPYRPWTMSPIGSGPVRVHHEEVNPPRRLVTPFTLTTAVTLSGDGTRLAVTNNERASLHEWPNLKLDKSSEWRTRDEWVPIENPAGLPPGARIEPPDGHNIWVLDGSSGKTLQVLAVPHAEKTTALAFDDRAKSLLSYSSDSWIRLWDVDSGNLLRAFNATDSSYNRLAFSPNGRWIAGVSGRPRSLGVERDRGVVSVWETATGRIVAQFEVSIYPDHFRENHVWAFHGNLVAVPVSGRLLKVWDLDKGRLALEMNNLGRTIDDVAFVASGKRLVSAGDGRMTLWTLETESEICSFSLPPYGKGQWPIIVDVLEQLGNQPKPGSRREAPGTVRPRTGSAVESERVSEDGAGLVADRGAARKPAGSSANRAAATRGPVVSRFEDGSSEGWYTLNEDYTRGATSPPRVDSAVFPQGRNSWLVAEDALKTKEFGWHAPKEYHGDHSDKFGKLLRYSIWTTATEGAGSDWNVRLRGAGKLLYVNAMKPPEAKVWQTYSIKLDASGGWWVFRGRSGDGPATDQDLKEVLSDVTDLRIKGEFGPSPNTGCLDNVEFGAEP